MKPIKLALKNITKLNKFIFILLNLCPWVFGSTDEEKIPFNSEMETSLIVKKNEKPDGNDAYKAFLEFAWKQQD